MGTDIMNKNTHSYCKVRAVRIFIVATLLMAIALPAFAVDDDIPFFAEGANGAPNVMFIFDNSDSMQDMPFLRADSRPVRPGTDPESFDNSIAQTWKWQQGVQLNTDNTVKEDSSGRVIFDYAAYPSDTEMAIPTQEPDFLPGNTYPDEDGNFTWTGEADVDNPMVVKVLPKQIIGPLPGYGSLTGTVTNTGNNERIYDNTAALDWTDPLLSDDDTFNENYRYRLVEVYPDDSTELPQVRTIRSRSTGSKYFRVYTNVEAGGPLVYTGGKNYKYRILTDGPGRVTRVRSELNRLVDADIDWTVVASDWDGSWKNKIVTITAASGAAAANVDLSRTITSYSENSKYWRLDSDLPVACDFSCKYEIRAAATDPSRIYDADLDWITPDNVLMNNTKFNEQYRYRAVEVRSKVGETVQRRTILSRSKSHKYFTIDTAAEAGGPLVYDQDELNAVGGGYTYTIMTDGPGPVTRVRPDAADGNKITDAHIDWASISPDFWSRWYNRTIEIVDGKNKGEKRKITNYSTGSKYWRVESPFSQPCDLTTKYKIIGTPDDDNRYAFGGNHPASKLYQAKKAMNLFLNDPALKYCAEKDADGVCIDYNYSLNMGFATYLSARVPRVHARYYKYIPENIADAVKVWVPYKDGYWTTDPPPVPSRVKRRYKKYHDHWAEFIGNDSDSKFTASGWKTAPSGSTAWVYNREFTDVSVGFTFDRLWSEGACLEQTISYTVTEITPYPGTDGTLPNRHKFKVRSRVGNEGGYWDRHWRYFNGLASCAAAPATDGSYIRIDSGEPCYSCTFTPGYDDDSEYIDPVPAHWKTITPAVNEKAYYKLKKGWHFNGHFDITNPNADYYVDPMTGLTNPPATYSGYTWLENDMMNVSINTNGDLGDLLANTYDSSYFVYPGYGTNDHPHGWSYKKTVKDDGTTPAPWIYATSRWWDGAYFPIYWAAGFHNPSDWKGYKTNWESWHWSKWGDDVQETDYFPALIGTETSSSNVSGHDQVVFVNLPEYDSSDAFLGDDIDGANLDKIKNFTSITRVPNPDMASSWAQRFDYTVMPFSNSIAPNAYSALKGSGTPIAASLGDLRKYYESYIKQDPKSLAKCRQNYVIFLTDGVESGGGDPVEAARALYEDITIDGKQIPVKTYVVGFGMDEDSQEVLNNIADAGGTDHAYFADNVEALVTILIKDIVTEITGGSFSRSSPAITRYRPGYDLNLYSAYFDWPTWRGHLRAFDVDSSTGLISGLAASWVGDCNGDGINDGDAGCIMNTQGRGTVYTSVLDSATGTPLVFDPDNAATVTALGPFINAPDTATVMRYILDPGYSGGAYVGNRDANWLLGDIYHSKPVVVGPPRFTPPSTGGVDPYLGYTEFKTDHSARDSLVYVGANDGMVHAFRAANGHERWAYIPNSVLGKLKEIGTEGHRFTVDSSMKAADIFSPGGGSTIWPTFGVGNEKLGWHTLLTSGLRDGGSAYFGLDVTNLTPKVAWEVSDNDLNPSTRDMGRTWSVPSFGRLKIDGEYRYVIFIGGGISDVDNTGNNVYIIDAASGVILKEINIGGIDNNVPSEIRLVAETDASSPYYGNVSRAYVGDTNGDLYRINNLNDEFGGVPWTPLATRIFDGIGKTFYRPAISKSRGNCKVTVDGVIYDINPDTTFIFYGTGNEDGGMMNELSTDRAYAIADPPLTKESDSSVTLGKVWEVHFDVGEKMSSTPYIHLNKVYFNTYTPIGGCGKGETFLTRITIPKCGSAGGEIEKSSWGMGMFSGATYGGLVTYSQGPTNSNNDDDDDDGDDLDDPDEFVNPSADKLEYWREEF